MNGGAARQSVTENLCCHLSRGLDSDVLEESPLNDEEVVSRVLAGDSALFEILMRRYNQRVYRAVRAVLRTDDDAEDVMQQAYLNAYRSLHQFEGRAQFSTWLTRIAVNEAIARRKRDSDFMTGEDDVMTGIADDNAPDPEQQTITAELRSLLEREVSSLPDTFRTVFMLRDVEGLSTVEAATSLGISEDLVKTRLHRARATLRHNLCRRADVTVESLFTFGNARCDRVVAAVMAEIA
ncbi:MAG: polymerase sigma-54 factor RpoN [Acidobacteria bacterium]|nr:polymerase sigma-54 factor RpoN [Acidobacteriota bacterium]